MVARTGSWSDFKVRVDVGPPDDDGTYMDLTLRLFSTADGREWLQRTLQRRLTAPQTSGSDFTEGRRQELLDIPRVMAKARERLEKKAQQAS